MHVVFWDTRASGVWKDGAGGFGLGPAPKPRGIRGRLVRRLHRFDRAPTALVAARLAAVFRRLGHTVQCVEDTRPPQADLYVFFPALATLSVERPVIARLLSDRPGARVLVVGKVASLVPEAFDGLDVTRIKGEAEQLLWKLDDVLARRHATVQLGLMEDLDHLPPADWSPFRPGRFRMSREFRRFGVASIEHGRGCPRSCHWCPAIVPDGAVRFRDPQAVADEIQQAHVHWGFRCFGFLDPLFGHDAARTFALAERLERLPFDARFSIQSRVELLPGEMLRVLRRVGLSSVNVAMETSGGTAVDMAQAAEFMASCRKLGVRVAARFLIGFPDDTLDSVRLAFDTARRLNPTFAEFQTLTPYPGTPLALGYTPTMRLAQLTAGRLESLLAKCQIDYYFRWGYVREHVAGLRPSRESSGREASQSILKGTAAHEGPPRPAGGADLLRRKGLRQDGPHDLT